MFVCLIERKNSVWFNSHGDRSNFPIQMRTIILNKFFYHVIENEDQDQWYRLKLTGQQGPLLSRDLSRTKAPQWKHLLCVSLLSCHSWIRRSGWRGTSSVIHQASPLPVLCWWAPPAKALDFAKICAMPFKAKIAPNFRLSVLTTYGRHKACACPYKSLPESCPSPP